MPRRKNSNPQKKEPKLLKIANKQSQRKNNVFKRATNLFHDKFLSYQQGVNPKQKASSDLLAAGNTAKHLATIATHHGKGAHIASKIGRARYQKRRVKNIHTVNESLSNSMSVFKPGKKAMELNPREPPLVPPPVPPFMQFDSSRKHHHTFEAR